MRAVQRLLLPLVALSAAERVGRSKLRVRGASSFLGNGSHPGSDSVPASGGASGVCHEGMLLAPFMTTRKDWQRNVYVKPTKAKVDGLLRSTEKLGICVTIVYDSLPASVVQALTTQRTQFIQVSLEDYSKRMTPNDLRFLVFAKIVQDHPEWPKVFLVDAFDVKAVIDPFPHMEEGKLYVGSDIHPLASRHNGWVSNRFKEMGGRYYRWFVSVSDKRTTLNAGLVGGCRNELLSFLKVLNGVLQDPSLAAWTVQRYVHVNMAAVNYAVYAGGFASTLVTGAPISSNFKRQQVNRKDVWFIHK